MQRLPDWAAEPADHVGFYKRFLFSPVIVFLSWRADMPFSENE
ncbi:MAG: hypothetical protein CM15mP74_27720 [Halieaceae bacterium]|nr:MAG: hypothetical protein CM15mP74_27720 [Halieaceae bacterium]